MCKFERRIIEDLMVERLEKNRLIAVSGMSIEELTDAFVKGYSLVSPKAAKDDVPDDLRIAPKIGHWINLDGCGYKCSECGRIIDTNMNERDLYMVYPYCHCGIKMREGEG